MEEELTVGETAAVISAISAAAYSIKMGGARRMSDVTEEVPNEERIETLVDAGAKLISSMCRRNMQGEGAYKRCLAYGEKRMSEQFAWYEKNGKIAAE